MHKKPADKFNAGNGKFFPLTFFPVIFYIVGDSIFIHADELESMGLDVPVICKLANEMRKSGLPLEEGIYEEDALYHALLNLWKGGNEHAE